MAGQTYFSIHNVKTVIMAESVNDCIHNVKTVEICIIADDGSRTNITLFSEDVAELSKLLAK